MLREQNTIEHASRDALCVDMFCISKVAMKQAHRVQLPTDVGLLKVTAVFAGIELIYWLLAHVRLSRYLGVSVHRRPLCQTRACNYLSLYVYVYIYIYYTYI